MWHSRAQMVRWPRGQPDSHAHWKGLPLQVLLVWEQGRPGWSGITISREVDRQGFLEVGPRNHQEVKQSKNQLGDQIGCLLGLDLLEVHQDKLDQIERVFQETAEDQYLRRKAVK